MATIIKGLSERTRSAARQVEPVAFNFHDMADRADGYLDTVRDKAAQIVADAHEQAEQVRRQAEETGRRAAEEAAERVLNEKVGQRMETLLPTIEQSGEQLADARGAWQAHWEQSAVALATRMAERIVRRELQHTPEIALDIVRQALELVAGSEEISVHISPADYEHLGEQVKTLAATIGQLAPADVVADESIADGGCRVLTRFGEVDNQIETQLSRLEAELT